MKKHKAQGVWCVYVEVSLKPTPQRFRATERI